MTVSYRMKAADHWALNRYVMTHDPRSVGSMVAAALLIPGIMFASMLRDGKTLYEAGTAAFTVIGISIIAGYPLFRLMAWRKFRALAARLQSIEMTLEPSGVRLVTPTADKLVKWSAIERVRRDRQAIYLFLSRKSALIVPTRAFTTWSDVESFYESARRHTGGK